MSGSAASDVIARLRGAANYEFGNLTPEQKDLYRAAADAIEAAHALLHGAEVDHIALGVARDRYREALESILAVRLNEDPALEPASALSKARFEMRQLAEEAMRDA